MIEFIASELYEATEWTKHKTPSHYESNHLNKKIFGSCIDWWKIEPVFDLKMNTEYVFFTDSSEHPER